MRRVHARWQLPALGAHSRVHAGWQLPALCARTRVHCNAPRPWRTLPAQTFARRMIADSLVAQQQLDRFLYSRPAGTGQDDFETMVSWCWASTSSVSHLDLGRAPYVLYGVKYIDLVSLVSLW